MIQLKLMYYCASMSDFKGGKFETIVITAYFDIFQLKPIVNTDNVHNFTKISSFSLSRVEICSSKFQIGDSFSHFSYHTELAIVLALDMLISHQCLVVSK